MTIIIISALLAISIVIFFYLVFTPKISTETFYVNKNSSIDPSLKKALNFFGGDISALLPEAAKKRKRRNHNLNRLFVTSGNPWNISVNEFFILQVFLGLGGLVLGAVCALVLSSMFSTLAIFGIVGGLCILGYMYPYIYYKSVSDDRIKAFKRELPEAIDYLEIAMSGGTFGLPIAIEKVIKYLPDGVMRKEFIRIVDSLNAGKSLTSALDEFAERAPTEGIKAFVNSLNNANRLNAPISEILKNRSEASRKELNAEIDKKIATLSTKILLVFGPMAYSSVLIVVLAPVISKLVGLLA